MSSRWVKARDAWEKVNSLGLYDPKKSRRAEADVRHSINDQIKAYKEQTELARQQLEETRNEKESEKRRIQEKQIRSLRRNYRAPSLAASLGNGEPATQDTTNKLGG